MFKKHSTTIDDLILIRVKEFIFYKDDKSVYFGIERLFPSNKHQIINDLDFRNTQGIQLIS